MPDQRSRKSQSCDWGLSYAHGEPLYIIVAALAWLTSCSVLCWSSHSLGHGNWTLPLSKVVQNAISEILLHPSILTVCGILPVAKECCLRETFWIKTRYGFSLPAECYHMKVYEVSGETESKLSNWAGTVILRHSTLTLLVWGRPWVQSLDLQDKTAKVWKYSSKMLDCFKFTWDKY